MKQEQLRRQRQIFRPKRIGMVRGRYISKETPSRTGKTALIRDCGYEGHVLVQMDDLSDPYAYGWHPMRAEKFEVLNP